MKLFSLDFLLLVTAQYGNQNSAGSAFGDPHFMVVTEGQEPLCFDFNPPAGSNMTLIMDPVSNLIIVATVEDRSEEKSYMTKIHFVSPGGAQMNFDTTGVHLSGLPKSYVATADEEGKIAYGDVNFVEHWSEDGTRDKIIVEVTDGPSFLIKEKVIRGTLSFGITDTSGLSEKCHGIIGQFVKPNAYQIKRDRTNSALVTTQRGSVRAELEDFHHTQSCWTVQEEEIYALIN